MYCIVDITANIADLYEEILKVRIDAWSDFQTGADAYARMADDLGVNTRHLAAYCGDQIVGAARLSIHRSVSDLPDPLVYEPFVSLIVSQPLASFNRLVLLRDHRKKGLARRLDIGRLEAARRLGCQTGVCYTSVTDRIERLRDLGWQEIGVGNKSAVFAERPKQTVMLHDLCSFPDK